MSEILLDLIKKIPWNEDSGPGPRSAGLPFCENLRKVTMWLTWVVQKDVALSGLHIQEQTLPTVDEIGKEFEFTTVYHAKNLLSAIEIIGYKHPNKQVAKQAQRYYSGLVNFLNLNPETEEELDGRRKDMAEKKEST
jgi:predicted TIM-barrel fold metal-dependent hydrolase